MSQYIGKYARNTSPQLKIPVISWVLIVIAVLGLLIGGVAAYLSDYTGAVANDFLADQPTDPVVLEDTFTEDSTTKTNVKVDVGKPGYAVYVRAMVVVTWKDAAGKVLGVAPVPGTDYFIEYNTNDWYYRDSDGFYYYKQSVAFDGSNEETTKTSVLIKTCYPIDGKTPAGYGLNVEIIAQTIQALGDTDGGKSAVEDAWKIDMDSLS